MNHLQQELKHAIEGNIPGVFLEIIEIFHKIYLLAMIGVQAAAEG